MLEFAKEKPISESFCLKNLNIRIFPKNVTQFSAFLLLLPHAKIRQISCIDLLNHLLVSFWAFFCPKTQVKDLPPLPPQKEAFSQL